MTRQQFDALMKDASRTTAAAGKLAIRESYEDHTSPQVSDTQLPERPPELARRDEGKASGAKIPTVRYTLRRVQLLDVDAKWGSVKDTLDGLQNAGFIHSDKEGEVHLEVCQEKVRSYKEEETVIEIETDAP